MLFEAQIFKASVTIKEPDPGVEEPGLGSSQPGSNPKVLGRGVGGWEGGPHVPTPNKTPELRPVNMWHSSRFHKPVLSFEVHKLVQSFVVLKLHRSLDILKWASPAVLPPYHLAYNYHLQFMAAIS